MKSFLFTFLLTALVHPGLSKADCGAVWGKTSLLNDHTIRIGEKNYRLASAKGISSIPILLNEDGSVVEDLVWGSTGSFTAVVAPNNKLVFFSNVDGEVIDSSTLSSTFANPREVRNIKTIYHNFAEEVPVLEVENSFYVVKIRLKTGQGHRWVEEVP